MPDRDDAFPGRSTAAERSEAVMVTRRASVASVAFDDGFTDRVIARLNASQSPFDALPRMFARLAPLAMAATLLLAAMNLFSSRASHQSVMERVLGLPTLAVTATPSFDDDLSRWGIGVQ